MRRLLQEFDRLRRQEPELRQAVENIRDDIRSSQNPNGNLEPLLVEALESGCRAGRPLRQVIGEHLCTERPELHRTCAPPSPVRRVMARSDFVSYHILRKRASSQTRRRLYRQRLDTGDHSLKADELHGRTGRERRPCWWTFEEPDRSLPNDGRTCVAELALGDSTRRRIRREGALVDLILARDLASDRYFKPTSLEGFGPNTPFRPERAGTSFGMTVPQDPKFLGRPETVSASAPYSEILAVDDEVTIRVLAYRETS